jgi:hypothetical protein
MASSNKSDKIKSKGTVERGSAKSKSEATKKVQNITRDKKINKSTGQTQYPAKVGYHGSDDEKTLSPEE